MTQRLSAVEKVVREAERGAGGGAKRGATTRRAGPAGTAPAPEPPSWTGEDGDADLASEELAVVTEAPPFP